MYLHYHLNYFKRLAWKNIMLKLQVHPELSFDNSAIFGNEFAYYSYSSDTGL